MKLVFLMTIFITQLGLAGNQCDVDHYNYLLKDKPCYERSTFSEVFSSTDENLEFESNRYDEDYDAENTVVSSDDTIVSVYYRKYVGYGASQAEVDQFWECRVIQCYITDL